LEDDKTIDVQDAPTFFGTTGFTITSHVNEGFITATIDPPTRQTPEEIVIRLRHPDGKPLSSADVHGAKQFTVDVEDSTVHLTPAKNTITVQARYAD
jgi:hypothetical protein